MAGEENGDRPVDSAAAALPSGAPSSPAALSAAAASSSLASVASEGKEAADDATDRHVRPPADADDLFLSGSVRVCSSTLLSWLASEASEEFGREVLDAVMLLVRTDLTGGNAEERKQPWQEREAALMALQCISDPPRLAAEQLCTEPLWSALLRCGQADGEHVHVRARACTALGHLSGSVLRHAQAHLANDYVSFFTPLVQVLLSQLCGPHIPLVVVRSAAEAMKDVCPALQEEHMQHYMKKIATEIAAALPAAKLKKRAVFCDLLRCICPYRSRVLVQGDLLESLVDVLLGRLMLDDPRAPDATADLLQTLCAMAHVAASHFSPVVDRSLRCTLVLLRAHVSRFMVAPSGEPLVSLLFFVTSLLRALDDVSVEAEALIELHADDLFPLLLRCLTHPLAPVRWTAFQLLGDLATHCFAYLRPLLPHFLPRCVTSVCQYHRALSLHGPDADGASRGELIALSCVAVDAFTAYAQMAVKATKEELEESGAQMIECMRFIWTRKEEGQEQHMQLHECMARAFSSLARVDVQAVVPFVTPPLLRQWLSSMAPIGHWSELEPCVQGVLSVWRAQPRLLWDSEGAFPATVALIHAVVCHEEEGRVAAEEKMGELLHQLKREWTQEEWERRWNECDNAAKEKLHERFAL
jgi:hypothetical protein